MSPCLNGGDKRDRTADPLLARQVLSQLSYTPTNPDYDNRRISSSVCVFLELLGSDNPRFVKNHSIRVNS